MMKKVLTLALSVSLIFGSAIINHSSAQVLDEGNILIEAYYGFPNLYTTVLKSTYASGSDGYEENIEVGGAGPIGVRGEYLITEKFGIGLDMNYTNTYISWTEDWQGTTYNYKVSVPRIRAMAKFNFHFVQTDQFNAYTSFGAGYGSLKYVYDTNDPNWTTDEDKFPIPVSFRLAAGARYFFTENIGVNLEFGLFGGALIHGGLSFKI